MDINGYIRTDYSVFKSEMTRKLMHITIALIPTVTSWNVKVTISLLVTGLLIYSVNEKARFNGRNGGIISRLTVIAARPLESGFVWGPVTLGLGALSALIYYPGVAMDIAIYSLAFGDSIASLAGKYLNRKVRINIGSKTLAGSLSCFLMVCWISSFHFDSMWKILVCAFTATLLEMFCVQDADNLFIPVGTGFIASLLI